MAPHIKRLPAVTYIILLAIALRLVFFIGIYDTDDLKYAAKAFYLSEGKFTLNSWENETVLNARAGLLVPVAFCFKVFGISEASTLIYPFLVSLATILLVFFAGRLMFNETAGLAACLIYALLPLDVSSATTLFPDSPAAFWTAVGMLAIYLGLSRGFNPLACGVVSGLGLGVSWLHKESVFYSLFFVAFLAVSNRSKPNARKLFAGLGLTLAFILAVEALFYFSMTGDLGFRYRLILNNQKTRWLFNEGTPLGWVKGHYLESVFRRIFLDGPKFILVGYRFNFTPLIALFAIVYALKHKREEFRFAGMWFLFSVFALNFGSTSILFYQPMVLFERYMYPMLFPATLIAGGLIATLSDSIKSKVTQTRNGKLSEALLSATILLVIFGIFAGLFLNYTAGKGSPVEREIAQMVSPNESLYTDRLSAMTLRFFWKYPSETNVMEFESMSCDGVRQDAYVLINRRRTPYLTNNKMYRLPEFYEQKNIPTSWRLLWNKSDAVLYKTAKSA